MSQSLKLGRVAGIGIQVHWTFLLLIGWVVFVYVTRGATALQVLEGVVFILLVFVCIVLHELGHALTARRFGIGTRDITLLPIGGLARLERMPDDPTQELLVALGGPAVTAVIAGVLSGVALAVWGPAGIFDMELIGGNMVAKLAWVNAILLGFNLLPAFPMDGGRVLRAALHYQLDYVEATRIASLVGKGMAICFGLFALFVGNIWLVVIAFFVFFGAHEEGRSGQIRALCRGVPVHHAMVTRFRTLDPETSLDDAVKALLEGSQQDFPVTDDDRILGMLNRDALVRAMESGEAATVGQIMRECAPVDEHAMLEDTFQRMRGNGCATVPVMRGDRLVGIITLENVGEWMMVHSALRRARARHKIEDLFANGP